METECWACGRGFRDGTCPDAGCMSHYDVKGLARLHPENARLRALLVEVLSACERRAGSTCDVPWTLVRRIEKEVS